MSEEYIKKSDAIAGFESWKSEKNSAEENFFLCGAKEVIQSIPAADVEPVVHAHWKWKAPYMVCSACNRHSINRYQSKRCQHCGAHMRSGESGDAE